MPKLTYLIDTGLELQIYIFLVPKHIYIPYIFPTQVVELPTIFQRFLFSLVYEI